MKLWKELQCVEAGDDLHWQEETDHLLGLFFLSCSLKNPGGSSHQLSAAQSGRSDRDPWSRRCVWRTPPRTGRPRWSSAHTAATSPPAAAEHTRLDGDNILESVAWIPFRLKALDVNWRHRWHNGDGDVTTPLTQFCSSNTPMWILKMYWFCFLMD